MFKKGEGGKTIIFLFALAVFMTLLTICRRRIVTTLRLDIQRNCLDHASTEEEYHSRIILMETSGNGSIKLRLMASVESAARYNPKMEILVFLVTNNKTELTECMKDVGINYPNVRYIHTTAEESFNQTELYSWYKSKYPSTLYPAEHLSDALRLIYLIRYGSIYLDLDVIVQKELRLPKNAVFHLEYGENMIVNGIMVFQKDHPFLLQMLRALELNFSPFIYFSIGPALMANEYKMYKVDNRDVMEYPPGEVVYSSPWWTAKCAFLDVCTDYYMDLVNGTSMVHWINSLSPKMLNSSLKTGYTKLVEQHAPVTFAAMKRAGVVP